MHPLSQMMHSLHSFCACPQAGIKLITVSLLLGMHRQQGPSLSHPFYAPMWSAERSLLCISFYTSIWSAERSLLCISFYTSIWSAERSLLCISFYTSIWSAERSLLCISFYTPIWSATVSSLCHQFHTLSSLLKGHYRATRFTPLIPQKVITTRFTSIWSAKRSLYRATRFTSLSGPPKRHYLVTRFTSGPLKGHYPATFFPPLSGPQKCHLITCHPFHSNLLEDLFALRHPFYFGLFAVKGSSLSQSVLQILSAKKLGIIRYVLTRTYPAWTNATPRHLLMHPYFTRTDCRWAHRFPPTLPFLSTLPQVLQSCTC